MEWFRLYSEALDDPKVQRLPGDLYKGWVNLLCLANRQSERGTLPPLADIAFALRCSDTAADALLSELIARDLIHVTPTGYAPHNWEGRQPASDDGAARKRAYRHGTPPAPVPPAPLSPVPDMSQDTERDMSQHMSRDMEQDISRTGPVLDKSRVDQTRSEENTIPPTPQPEPTPAEAQRGARLPKLTSKQQTAFDTLWTKYPARRGSRGPKQEALTAFSKIVEADWPDLALALDNYRAVCSGPDARLPKDACRFLRDNYWRDYVDIDPTPDTSSTALAVIGGTNARRTASEREAGKLDDLATWLQSA